MTADYKGKRDNKDRLHCYDGPAVEEYGNEEWYYRGRRHRIGGPAVTKKDGTTAWYIHGKYIRNIAQYKILANASNQEILKLSIIYGSNFLSNTHKED